MSVRFTLELVLLAALWGASFLFMRVATPEFGPIALIQIRVMLASFVLLPIWWVLEGKKQYGVAKAHWRTLALVGALNSAVPFVLFAFSTLYITGGMSAILNSTAPIWGAVVGLIWFQKTVSKNIAAVLTLGLLGVIVLVSGSMRFPDSDPLWIALALFAGLSASFLYGIAANVTATYLGKVSSLTIATFSLVAASLLLLPFSLSVYPSTSISMQAWGAVIAMGIFSTALANILYFDLLRNLGSAKALTVTFLIPVFASLWGALFIGESVTSAMVFGGAIILVGLALVTGLLKIK